MPIKFIRKPNRLPFKEIYRTNNSFFVTLCVEGRVDIFGDVENGELKFSSTGNIVQETWLNLPNIFEHIVLGEFVVMPNHFHGIITFLDVPISKFTGRDSDLSKIIKYFKSKITLQIKKLIVAEKLVSPLLNHCNPANSGASVSSGELKFSSTKNLIQNYKTIWQKSFYDHVIRNEQDLHRIQEYIYNNPLQWELDILNLKNDGKYQQWLKLKKKPVVDL